jgi:hypothetical protein
MSRWIACRMISRYTKHRIDKNKLNFEICILQEIVDLRLRNTLIWALTQIWRGTRDSRDAKQFLEVQQGVVISMRLARRVCSNSKIRRYNHQSNDSHHYSLIEVSNTDPFLNFAYEEYLLHTTNFAEKKMIMLCQNKPTVHHWLCVVSFL